MQSDRKSVPKKGSRGSAISPDIVDAILDMSDGLTLFTSAEVFEEDGALPLNEDGQEYKRIVVHGDGDLRVFERRNGQEFVPVRVIPLPSDRDLVH